MLTGSRSFRGLSLSARYLLMPWGHRNVPRQKKIGNGLWFYGMIKWKRRFYHERNKKQFRGQSDDRGGGEVCRRCSEYGIPCAERNRPDHGWDKSKGAARHWSAALYAQRIGKKPAAEKNKADRCHPAGYFQWILCQVYGEYAERSGEGQLRPDGYGCLFWQ